MFDRSGSPRWSVPGLPLPEPLVRRVSPPGVPGMRPAVRPHPVWQDWKSLPGVRGFRCPCQSVRGWNHRSRGHRVSVWHPGGPTSSPAPVPCADWPAAHGRPWPEVPAAVLIGVHLVITPGCARIEDPAKIKLESALGWAVSLCRGLSGICCLNVIQL